MKFPIIVGIVLAALLIFGIERANAHMPPSMVNTFPGKQATRFTYSHERPANEPLLTQIRQIANSFWDQRGVPAGNCNGNSTFLVATIQAGFLGYAYSNWEWIYIDSRWHGKAIPTCITVFSDALVGKTIAYLNSRLNKYHRRLRATNYISNLCKVGAHEEGHARGLYLNWWDADMQIAMDGHPASGLMSGNTIPGDCIAFARQLVRQTYRNHNTN